MKISLYARIQKTVGSGAEKKQIFSWFKVETEKRGRRIQPKEPEKIGNYVTPYFLRYTENGQRKMESIGKNFVEAVTALRYRQDRHMIQDAGGNVDAMPDPSLREPIADAVAAWLQKLKTLDKAKGTITAYTPAVNQFLAVCRSMGKTFMDQIDQRAVLAYMQWVRDTLPRRRRAGKLMDQNGTVRTRLRNISVFFLAHGIANPLPKKEWPKVAETDVTIFTIEDVNQILSKATEDETDLIQFFLFTGFRDDEVAHTFYSDINFKAGTVNIAEKLALGFRIKNRKQRKADITLPSDFLARMKARQNRNKGVDLIFPSNTGRPDTMLLARIRKAAKRAKYTAYFGCHQFRKTFATWYCEKFGIENTRQALGHADIRTTQKYLGRTKTTRAAVEELFAGVGK